MDWAVVCVGWSSGQNSNSARSRPPASQLLSPVLQLSIFLDLQLTQNYTNHKYHVNCAIPELRLAATLESKKSSIAFVPLLSRFSRLTSLQLEGIIFSMDNDNTFTTFIRHISADHLPLLHFLEFTDCEFRQHYIPRLPSRQRPSRQRPTRTLQA